MPRAFRSDVSCDWRDVDRVSPCWERRDARLGRHERWATQPEPAKDPKPAKHNTGLPDGVKMIRDVAVR